MTDRERESERESVLTGCIKVLQYHAESLSDVIYIKEAFDVIRSSLWISLLLINY